MKLGGCTLHVPESAQKVERKYQLREIVGFLGAEAHRAPLRRYSAGHSSRCVPTCFEATSDRGAERELSPCWGRHLVTTDGNLNKESSKCHELPYAWSMRHDKSLESKVDTCTTDREFNFAISSSDLHNHTSAPWM